MKKIIIRILLAIVLIAIVAGGYLVTIRRMDNKLADAKDFPPTAVFNNGFPTLLPSYFLDGERFYIKMETPGGDTIVAYCDSGGGLCMIPPHTADKLNLNDKIKRGMLRGVMPVQYISFDDIVEPGTMPVPSLSRSFIIRQPFRMVDHSFLFMPPMDKEMKFIVKNMSFDLFMGQDFFMHRAWTIDYPNRQLWVNTPLQASDTAVQPIGFQKNSNGEYVHGHGSITMNVDGETIDMLFDTGASMVLSEKGKQYFHTDKKTIGGSFIAKSVFEKWRKAHPDWKYYPKADFNADVIEVPVVKLGNYEAGPVLFAERPDEVWSQGMIQTMDKVVKGAIGGSALKYFKVTIDYNSGLIRFMM